ncbi:MAG: transcriptional regulator [Deltaproteobacteria bacterium]|nr:transcriptional regulator [Deltaproteobacteria bacterium]
MARKVTRRVVLIADATADDFMPVAHLLGWLSDAGDLAELWSDGTEGLRRLSDVAADLAVVDLDTPSLCGMDALARIARLAARTPVLLLAREGGPERKMWAVEAGAVGMVTKPVDGQTLFRFIDKLLDTI